VWWEDSREKLLENSRVKRKGLVLDMLATAYCVESARSLNGGSPFSLTSTLLKGDPGGSLKCI
jgi:hypothetical protein